MKSTGALVEVETQEDGMSEEISTQGNGAEGDIHSSSEVFPQVAAGLQSCWQCG